MLSLFRNKQLMKLVVAYVIIAHITQIIGPTQALALTSGPSTPEVASFTPVGTSDLVNVTSGSFSYNIPLLDVGGYPINISYNSGMGMEDESSIVGHGWNLNVGAINRSMRGLPDEFKGDWVQREMHMKPNKTWGLNLGLGLEAIGIEADKLPKAGLSFGLGYYHNNYTGNGFEASITPTLSAGDKFKTNLGLGLSYSGSKGFNMNASVGLSHSKIVQEVDLDGTKTSSKPFSIGNKASIDFNSRSGLTAISFSPSITANPKNMMPFKFGTKFMSYSGAGYTPKVSMESKFTSKNFKLKVGFEAKNLNPNITFGGYSNVQEYKDIIATSYGYGALHLEEGISQLEKQSLPQSIFLSGIRGAKDKVLLDFQREKESSQIIPIKEKDEKIYGTKNLAFAHLGHDFYQVNSQGIGGQFRVYRSEMGTVRDQVKRSSSIGFSLNGATPPKSKPKQEDGNNVGLTSDDPSSANLTHETMGHTTRHLSSDANDGTLPNHTEDPAVKDEAEGDKNNGGEAGKGALLKLGINAGFNATLNRSGYWTGGREFQHRAQFLKKTDPQVQNSITYEPAYFKAVGEMSVDSDPDFINGIQGTKAIQPKIGRDIIGDNLVHHSTNILVDDEGNQYAGQPVYARTKRARRNTMFSYLNAIEASIAGLDQYIYSYPLNESYHEYTANPEIPGSVANIQPTSGEITTGNHENQFYYFPRKTEDRPQHHPSEIQVKDVSGMRHIFGIPAMNYVNNEVTFATGKNLTIPEKGLVAYNTIGTADDNSRENRKGLDHYFSKTYMPPYAYAYHLTAMLSSDYVDVTGDGITDDDLGTAYKFNYTRIHKDYKWRAPFDKNRASHIPGLESKGLKPVNGNFEKGEFADDKGMYSYGEKEIWMVHSIETKGEYGFVAEFKYSNQNGGLGVESENGGKGYSSSLKKLDRIELYSKKDRLNHGENATPIKIVHFTYEYTLYPNQPNSLTGVDGKLTLKKVFFTYGKSNRARLNPYVFTYYGEGQPGTNLNPNYAFKAQNGWGTYRPNPTSTASPRLENYTWEFPYVMDDNIDIRSYACKLETITLPSGGEMKIEYESHDYAYVQDKRAMQMFKLAGFDKNPTETAPFSNKLFIKNGNSDYENNYVMFINLPQAITSDDADQEFIDRYLGDMFTGTEEDDQKYLFVSARVAIDPKHNADGLPRRYEQIEDYFQVDDAGVHPNNSQIGWIQLRPRSLKKNYNSDDKKPVNPISRKAWSFVKTNLNELIFPETNDYLADEDEVKGMSTFQADMISLFKGYNRLVQAREVANEIVPERSWVRLYAPYGTRKGGGARVKKISLSDNYAAMIEKMPREMWDISSSGNTSADQLYKTNTYGQMYEYKTSATIHGKAETISSGVAENLPQALRAENPLVQPIFFLQKNRKQADQDILIEAPMGEQVMPAPSIVYSHVKVKSLAANGQYLSPTGHVLHEHYTAKDFPVRFEETDIDPVKEKIYFFSPFLVFSTDMYTASQGYAIIRNDMHGKKKKISTFGQNAEQAMTYQQYNYRTESVCDGTTPPPTNSSAYPYPSGNLCNEDVPVVYDNGTRANARIGVEIDAVVDEMEHFSETMSAEMGFNLDISEAFVPTILPSSWPSVSYEKTRSRTLVLNKVIYQFGILDKVIAHDNGANIVTQNKAWDAETGNVILTQVENEFSDSRYAFSYPARWAYESLGPAYQNQGLSWKAPSGGSLDFNDLANGGDHRDYFSLGDRVLVSYASFFVFGLPIPRNIEAWVTDVDANGIKLMDRDGNYLENFNGSKKYLYLKIIESGKKNTTGTSMAAMTSTEDPFDATNTLNPQTQGKVLDASAIEYDDKALIVCGPLIKHGPCEACDNPSTEAKQFLGLLQALLEADLWLSTTAVNITSALTTDDDEGNRFVNELATALGVTNDCGQTECEIYYQAEPTPAGDDCYKGLKVKFWEDCGTGLTPVSGCQNGFDLNFDFSQMNDGDLFCLHHIDELSGIESPSDCEIAYDFELTASINFCENPDGSYDETLSEIIPVSGDACFPTINNCDVYKPEAECMAPGQQINPYVQGLKGIWHPTRSYGYVTGRTGPAMVQANDIVTGKKLPVDVNTNIRYDGAYDQYDPFWEFKNITQHWEKDPTKWQWASEVTKFVPYNYDIENASPLNIYSAAVYGYDYQLPVAVAGNAEFNQVTSVDFESASDVASTCRARFLIGNGDETPALTSLHAHSGKQSLMLGQLSDISAFHPLKIPKTPVQGCEHAPEAPLDNFLRECDCMGNFSPSADQYVLSVWVKSSGYDLPSEIITPTAFDHAQVEIFINGSAAQGVEESRSAIIDGWQQVEYIFEITPTDINATHLTRDIEIRFKNTDPAKIAYFDDLRIHPADASMVSYVYDPVALRLVAQGDERNYFTFYSYRPDGGLTGVMRETVKGKQSLNYNEANAAQLTN